ncbi:hypothetical protein CC85DRAFT_327165 [Cutaneotrichosporon oleaginosum]|uniref:Uncharacterized protein n=1 Tax=Cutaneotrichosporon oleaginosum TaxID=879819 RepID=A0A0J0XRA1_9TREE|nr:uncharacterized protein CC85DRAFT_327165 [Cutaneotrichosporon oleaginosum]KLT43620.1 hypothetical protein CC85DRAFT_327165 [Cutaneotrichosporon oleaginosum]TXT12712.1 hypothetical protein COLE_03122 [Cutaneotrichosporon oleaginosum]
MSEKHTRPTPHPTERSRRPRALSARENIRNCLHTLSAREDIVERPRTLSSSGDVENCPRIFSLRGDVENRPRTLSAAEKARLLTQMAAGLPGAAVWAGDEPKGLSEASLTTATALATDPLSLATGDMGVKPTKILRPPRVFRSDGELPSPLAPPAPPSASAHSAYSEHSDVPAIAFPRHDQPSVLTTAVDAHKGGLDEPLEAPQADPEAHIRHRLETFRRTVAADMAVDLGHYADSASLEDIVMVMGEIGESAAPLLTLPADIAKYHGSASQHSLDASPTVPSPRDSPPLQESLTSPCTSSTTVAGTSPPQVSSSSARPVTTTPVIPDTPDIQDLSVGDSTLNSASSPKLAVADKIDSSESEKDPEATGVQPLLRQSNHKLSWHKRITRALNPDIWISSLTYDVAVALVLFPRLSVWDDFWSLTAHTAVVISLWLSAGAELPTLVLLAPLLLVALGECSLPAFVDGTALPFQLVAASVAVHHAILFAAHSIGGPIGAPNHFVRRNLPDANRGNFGPLTVVRATTGVVRAGVEVVLLRGRWHRAAWSVLTAALAATAVPLAHHPALTGGLLASSVGLTLLLALWGAFLAAHRAVSAAIRQRARDAMRASLSAIARDIDALALDVLLAQLARFTAVLESMEADERRLFGPEEAAVRALHTLSVHTQTVAKQLRAACAALAAGKEVTDAESIAIAAFDAGMATAREFAQLRCALRIPADIAHAAQLDLTYWHAWRVRDADAWYCAKGVLAHRTLVDPTAKPSVQMLQSMLDPVVNWRAVEQGGNGTGGGGRDRWAQLLTVVLVVGVYRVVAPVQVLLYIDHSYRLWINFVFCVATVCLLHAFVQPAHSPGPPGYAVAWVVVHALLLLALLVLLVSLTNALLAAAHLPLLRSLGAPTGLGAYAPFALPAAWGYAQNAALVRLADTLRPPFTPLKDTGSVFSLRRQLEGHFARQTWPLYPSAGAVLTLLGLRGLIVAPRLRLWLTTGAGAVLAVVGSIAVAARGDVGGDILAHLLPWMLPSVCLYFLAVAVVATAIDTHWAY